LSLLALQGAFDRAVIVRGDFHRVAWIGNVEQVPAAVVDHILGRDPAAAGPT
jgi:hypothetical protein